MVILDKEIHVLCGRELDSAKFRVTQMLGNLKSMDFFWKFPLNVFWIVVDRDKEHLRKQSLS